MIPYATPELFSQDSVEKQLVISFTGGSFTNSDIESESFEWNDPMCSAEQLEFGECCAASVKFNIGIDSVPMQGKELTITITPSGGTAVSLGKFKVWSDVPTADRRWRTIEAYDAMADILNTECVSWYDGLFPVGTETYTVKQFRDSFFTFLGITQETVTLINDSETVAKTISTTSLSGKDVITSICQMNAVFGKIARDGKFKYVDLVTFGETLYPAEDLYPADDLYPAENTNVTELGANGTYLSCEYEDYVTDFIDKVQIREQENDIGVIVGSGTNAFIIENNFLLFGKGSLVLTPIATAIYNHISGIYFKPAKMVTVGNPLMETGDGIRLWTKYAMIDTYILNRKMTGIQSLRDSIEAKSPKARAEELNDTNHELIQLIGKSNKMSRTLEETISEISQIETTYATKTYADGVGADAIATADGHTDTKLGNYYPKSQTYTRTETDSRIKQTAGEIRTEVSQNYTPISTFNSTVSNLQDQIDDNIETFTGSAVPTLSNYPANEWTTTTEKDKHIGDLYVVNSSGGSYEGFYYRFEKANNVYGWTLIKDTEITKALQDSAQALSDVGTLATDVHTNYYTKTQTYTQTEINTAISQTADSITSTVSGAFSKYDEGSYYISYYGFGAPAILAQGHSGEYYLNQSNGYLYLSNGSAWSKVDELGLITDELSSSIVQTADSIVSTVSSSMNQYDEGNYTVSVYGFGVPDTTKYPPASHSGEYYLDNTSGKLYLSNGSAWSVVKTLKLITTEQGTAIAQNTSDISLKVGKGEVISSINQSAEQVTIDANRINLNGVVTANNNFKINLDGTMETIGATVNGEILSQELDETDPNNPIILNQADLDDSVLTFSERMRTDTNESGTQQTYELLPLTEYYPNHITLRQYSYKYYANNYGYRDFPCYNTSDPHESEIYLVGPSYVARNASDWTYDCLPILYIDGPERLYLRANNNVVIYSENITFPSSLKVRKRIQMYCGTQKVDMYDYDGSGSSYLYGSWVVQTGSDERIKKDIKNIEQKFIDAVGSIDLKQFVFKNRPEELDDKISLGVIAQDLIKALDAQGLDYKDYEVIGENDDRYFMVYDQFLVARCAYLENKVSKLEERIARLEEIMEGDNK